RPVRSHRDAWRFHIWSYAHFPLALGVVVTGVGIQRIVTAAARQPGTFSEGIILTGAPALVMLAMSTIPAAPTTGVARPATPAAIHVAIAAATVGCGVTGVVTTPALAVTIVAAALAAQFVTCVRLGQRDRIALDDPHVPSPAVISVS